jgi:hypothetical protein
MKAFLIAAALVSAVSIPIEAQETTKPIRYTWIVTSTTDWNEAMSVLAVSNGDSGVIVVPAGMNEKRWLILRRVEQGSIYIPEDEPFGCEVFKAISDATDRSAAMHSCHSPLVMSVPDGNAVVMSLRQCSTTPTRRRAVK